MRVQTLNGRFLLLASATVANMGIILIYSLFLSLPNPLDVPGGGLTSLLTHFTAYFALSLLVYETLRSSAWNLPPITRCFLGFTCAFLYSFVLEFLQFLTPSRQFELGDLSANFLGALLGAIVMVPHSEHLTLTRT